jgi:hypothetical protein
MHQNYFRIYLVSKQNFHCTKKIQILNSNLIFLIYRFYETHTHIIVYIKNKYMYVKQIKNNNCLYINYKGKLRSIVNINVSI